MDDLPGVMRRLSANFVMTTPTVLTLLEPADVPTLEVVYSCGEMLTPAVRDRFTQAGLTLGNVYGPTETTVSCTFDVVEDGSKDPTIIGKPFGWSRAYILDEDLKMVPHGAVGTLWIAGPQLSKGYLARPELTEALYRPDPYARGDEAGQLMYNTGDLCAWVEDGYLKCFGRADEQMKIRGQRVEVLEIEAVISRVPDVFAACVVKRVQDGREDLVAFYCVEVGSFTSSFLLSWLILPIAFVICKCCYGGEGYHGDGLSPSSCLHASFDLRPPRQATRHTQRQG